MRKSYNYVNALGLHKELVVHVPPNTDGTYDTEIWCMDTGDLVSTGNNTKEEIVNFLNHYGITADL